MTLEFQVKICNILDPREPLGKPLPMACYLLKHTAMSFSLVKPQVNTGSEKIQLFNLFLMFYKQSWGELLLCAVSVHVVC